MGPFDDDLRVGTRQRVDRERHSGHLRRHHLLNDHRERGARGLDAMVEVVAEDGVGHRRAVAVEDGGRYGVGRNVEHSLVLPGVRQIAPVLAGAGRPDGEAGRRLERPEPVTDLSGERFGQDEIGQQSP
jgi:hypothetical protein